MIPLALISFFSLFALLVIHEFSHLIAAKRFKVQVEEFGIGYPPRLFSKKIRDTLYSINLLPFGGFVKIKEEELKERPIWQRAQIVMAGIISFWVIALVLFLIIFNVGAPFQILDTDNGDLVFPRVQILSISPGSPAEEAGLDIGDVIKALKTENKEITVDKIYQVQEFTEQNKGREIVMTILRGNQIFDVDLTPRVLPPAGEGALGIGLIRVATKKYSFFSAISEAISTVFSLTFQIILGLLDLLKRVVLGEPNQAQLVGPVGILDIFVKSAILGPIYFLQTLGLISLHIAIMNALPIPAFDGGRLFFLIIEKIRKKPLNERIEQKVNLVFFLLLIFLMVWVTIKDIMRIF